MKSELARQSMAENLFLRARIFPLRSAKAFRKQAQYAAALRGIVSACPTEAEFLDPPGRETRDRKEGIPANNKSSHLRP